MLTNSIVVGYIHFANVGALEGIFIIESIVEHVSEALEVSSEIVKQKNLYEKGQVMRLHLANIMCSGCYGIKTHGSESRGQERAK